MREELKSRIEDRSDDLVASGMSRVGRLRRPRGQADRNARVIPLSTDPRKTPPGQAERDRQRLVVIGRLAALVPVPLLLATLFACFLPAHRASRVDPNVALRHL